MKHFRVAATALGLIALMTLPALAQRAGGGGGMMGGPAALLSNKGVQKELKLDDSQVTKVTKIADDMRTKQREAMQALGGLSPEERREKGMALNRSMSSDTNKALIEIFKPDQTKRYHQIRRQVGGADTFSDPSVASELKLTDDQKTKIKDLLSSQQAQMREIFATIQDDREGAMKKMAEMRKEIKDKIVALMSADQKKTWEILLGEPFDYVATPPPGR